jgi:hypothetical protein
MKYFEKEAGFRGAYKAIKKGVLAKDESIAAVAKMSGRRNNLQRLKHKGSPLFYNPKVQGRIAEISKDITDSNMLINKMASSPTSPYQGTRLTVQTREGQRKYNSKVLGKKKKADVLVPLWK